MATTNRGGSRASRGSKSRSSGRNNNPEGHNQYSGMMSTARENPLATAAAVGGAVAAGVFLWSRRNQISDQIGNLADQISEWREGLELNSDSSSEGSNSAGSFMANSGSYNPSDTKSQAQFSEEALTLKETGRPA